MRAQPAPWSPRSSRSLAQDTVQLTAQGTWLQGQGHYASHFSSLRDEAWLNFGPTHIAAPVRSGPPTLFDARARAGGHTTAPHSRPQPQGPATLPPSPLRDAQRHGPSTDGFNLPFQALVPRTLHHPPTRHPPMRPKMLPPSLPSLPASLCAAVAPHFGAALPPSTRLDDAPPADAHSPAASLARCTACERT